MVAYPIEPIAVRIEGHTETLNDLAQAGVMLTGHWPAEFYGSKAHAAARSACLDAIAGERDLSFARRKFIEAAREAGLLWP